ncbi:MAG: hypothetical protein HUU34_07380 [Saprospiraceae bacterium]|nr:hypothetical protein [Saprospiraceae bacterium]
MLKKTVWKKIKVGWNFLKQIGITDAHFIERKLGKADEILIRKSKSGGTPLFEIYHYKKGYTLFWCWLFENELSYIIFGNNLNLDEEKRILSEIESLQVIVSKGLEAFHSGKFSVAVSNLEKAILIRPNNTFLRYQLARSYERINQKEKALPHYTSIPNINPNSQFAAQSCLNAAIIHKEKNHYNEAMTTLENVFQLNPSDSIFKAANDLVLEIWIENIDNKAFVDNKILNSPMYGKIFSKINKQEKKEIYLLYHAALFYYQSAKSINKNYCSSISESGYVLKIVQELYGAEGALLSPIIAAGEVPKEWMEELNNENFILRMGLLFVKTDSFNRLPGSSELMELYQ